MKTRVLFVDDEPSILQGLQRGLRSMRATWEMHFAEGGAQALAILDTTPIDAVVTDLRMPGMDGAELLKQVSRRFPGVVRLSLSGTSAEEVLRVVGLAHQCLLKPCDLETLKATVTEACAFQAVYRRILERLEREELGAVVQAIADGLREAHPSLNIEVRIDPHPLPIAAPIDELVTALLNIAFNAVQAVASHGRVELLVRRLAEGGEVQIRDGGPGIPAEIRDRVFEPFVTTRPLGRGTGQGLAIARAILVARRGGTVAVDTGTGQGTTFTITVPAAATGGTEP